MQFKITVNDSHDNFGCPLTKLENTKYDTREAACEAIHDALTARFRKFGCEMVDRAEYKSVTAFLKACRDFILREGYAVDDGVMATVEEV